MSQFAVIAFLSAISLIGSGCAGLHPALVGSYTAGDMRWGATGSTDSAQAAEFANAQNRSADGQTGPGVGRSH